jgi:hypothetical protein
MTFMKLRSAFILLSVAMITGCSLTEEITFNKDFSGVVAYRYQLVVEEGVYRDSLVAEHRAMIEDTRSMVMETEGVSSVRFAVDPVALWVEIRVEFQNMNALNALYASDLFEEVPFLRKQFSHKGAKRFYLDWPGHGLSDEDRRAMDANPDDVLAINHYDLIINLPRAIRSSSVDVYQNIVNETTASVHFKGTWKSFYVYPNPMYWHARLR